MYIFLALYLPFTLYCTPKYDIVFELVLGTFNNDNTLYKIIPVEITNVSSHFYNNHK